MDFYNYTPVKHWFPYIKTRIEVVDTEVVEISPIEVSTHSAAVY